MATEGQLFLTVARMIYVRLEGYRRRARCALQNGETASPFACPPPWLKRSNSRKATTSRSTRPGIARLRSNASPGGRSCLSDCGHSADVFRPTSSSTGTRRMPGSFFDTNVLVYLASEDTAKADRAEEILGEGGVISVQVLNEAANVCRRKMRLSWAETRSFLSLLRGLLPVRAITVEIHEDRKS